MKVKSSKRQAPSALKKTQLNDINKRGLSVLYQVKLKAQPQLERYMLVKEAQKITGSMTRTSKMPGLSYSLPAWEC